MALAGLAPSQKLAGHFEFLKLRLLTLLNGKSAGPVVLAVTSFRNREGVSNVAANLAAVLAAEKEKRVLLMDGDLRRPSLYRVFRDERLEAAQDPPRIANPEMTPVRGYGSPAAGAPSWSVFSAADNLDVLLAGKRPTDDTRLFRQAEFDEFLEQAKLNYQFVILDCPPLFAGSGSPILCSKADGVLLVVAAGGVRRQQASRGLELLEEVGANVLGAVLNRREYPIPAALYRRL